MYSNAYLTVFIRCKLNHNSIIPIIEIRKIYRFLFFYSLNIKSITNQIQIYANTLPSKDFEK